MKYSRFQKKIGCLTLFSLFCVYLATRSVLSPSFNDLSAGATTKPKRTVNEVNLIADKEEFQVSQAGQKQESVRLQDSLKGEETKEIGAARWVKRERVMELNELPLDPTKIPDGKFRFSPFPGVSLLGEVVSVFHRNESSTAFSGNLLDEDGKLVGSVFLSSVSGENGAMGVAGRFALDSGELYVVQNSPDGSVVVEEEDASKYPGCGEAPRLELARSEGAKISSSVSTTVQGDATANAGPVAGMLVQRSSDKAKAKDIPITLRVLIGYLDEVETAYGGQEGGVQALLDLSILTANQAYVNSGINIRLELVHSVKVTYERTTFAYDLQRLAAKNDTYLDEIPALRDQYNADFASLFVYDLSPSAYCGMGYLLLDKDPSFSEYAYTVLNAPCAASMYSFAHEIGHNMGVDHDHDNVSDSMNHITSYGFGHHFGPEPLKNAYRTIMAYPPGTRVPYFSNPNITYQGFPTGIPEGQEDAADVARALNEISTFVAAYRGKNTISGTVTSSSGPFANVTIDGGSLGSVQTDTDGHYSFTNIPTGTSYVLTPSFENYAFSPASVSGKIYEDEVGDFSASWITYNLSGVVRAGQTPVSNVSVDGAGLGVRITDAQGRFTFSNVARGTVYSLSLSKQGYTFPNSPVAGTLLQQPDLAVAAVPFTYGAAGVVRFAGSGLVGVEISGGPLGKVISNSGGVFAFSAVAHDSHLTLTPSKTGYIFNPPSVSFTVTGVTNTEFTASIDPAVADDDNDGLTNKEEQEIGTSSTNPDTDDDGTTDGQEVIDGSNPIDPGSNVPEIETTVCSEWNGFLGGMWNIMEHLNLGTRKLKVMTKLYSLDGSAMESRNFYINPGNQIDIGVHDMPSRLLNSVGLICSTHDGEPGDLDGRMVYYKHVSEADPTIEFSFAMPFNNPTSGPQYVGFNTYQPSLAPGDSENMVVNWIQLSNVSPTKERGSLYLYDLNGKQVSKAFLTLKAGQRADYPAHLVGRSMVGLVAWIPESRTSKFLLRNVRYLYSNPTGEEHFDTAFQLEGVKGSGQTLVAPVDTREGTAVVELGNVTASKIRVAFKLYAADGSLVASKLLSIAGRASLHIIANDLSSNGLAMVEVKSDKLGSLVATVMQYGREQDGGISYMYGIPVREPMGSTLRGSYNTFLEQGCSLFIVNASPSRQNASISAVSYDGKKVVNGEVVSLPGYGVVDYNLCSRDSANRYGVATVQGTLNNSLYGTVVRKGKDEKYRFPSPMR